MPSDDVRTMFDSKYIGAWDLQGRDAVVTIEKVVGATVEGEGGRKDRAPLIYFVGKKKPLVGNKTNCKTIAGMFGSFKTSAWIGKKITLYATTCKGKAGGQVDCVRVRPTSPGGQPDTQQNLDAPVDPEMRRKQMQEAGEVPASDNPDEGP